MNDQEIGVNPAGYEAEMEALIMDDPAPNGYSDDSPAQWLRRALYAYESAKSAYVSGGTDSLLREIV
jgi:hypothetical protein